MAGHDREKNDGHDWPLYLSPPVVMTGISIFFSGITTNHDRSWQVMTMSPNSVQHCKNIGKELQGSAGRSHDLLNLFLRRLFVLSGTPPSSSQISWCKTLTFYEVPHVFLSGLIWLSVLYSRGALSLTKTPTHRLDRIEVLPKKITNHYLATYLREMPVWTNATLHRLNSLRLLYYVEIWLGRKFADTIKYAESIYTHKDEQIPMTLPRFRCVFRSEYIQHLQASAEPLCCPYIQEHQHY